MRTVTVVFVSDGWTHEVIREAAESHGCFAGEVRKHWPPYATTPILMVSVEGPSGEAVDAVVADLHQRTTAERSSPEVGF